MTRGTWPHPPGAPLVVALAQRPAGQGHARPVQDGLGQGDVILEHRVHRRLERNPDLGFTFMWQNSNVISCCNRDIPNLQMLVLCPKTRLFWTLVDRL